MFALPPPRRRGLDGVPRPAGTSATAAVATPARTSKDRERAESPGAPPNTSVRQQTRGEQVFHHPLRTDGLRPRETTEKAVRNVTTGARLGGGLCERRKAAF
uniref:Uncharacterized protein n=1 Tax=Knipowitschia caucasica TaxID=637954 RepID=A0AAV2LC40_KNICA